MRHRHTLYLSSPPRAWPIRKRSPKRGRSGGRGLRGSTWKCYAATGHWKCINSLNSGNNGNTSPALFDCCQAVQKTFSGQSILPTSMQQTQKSSPQCLTTSTPPLVFGRPFWDIRDSRAVLPCSKVYQELLKSDHAISLPELDKEMVREPTPKADTVFQLFSHLVQDQEANMVLIACAEEYSFASLPKHCTDYLMTGKASNKQLTSNFVRVSIDKELYDDNDDNNTCSHFSGLLKNANSDL